MKDNYFELTIEESTPDVKITIGLVREGFPATNQCGFDEFSYGYRSDNGKSYHKKGKIYGPTFSSGDTIGCGINLELGAIYYTKNGEFLGYSNYPIQRPEDLFCGVSLNDKCVISANFKKPFKFNTEKSKLFGWKIGKDKLNRLFYYNSTMITFVDPQESSKIHNSFDLNTLTKLITVHTSKSHNKVKKWKPIQSKRLLKALNLIPRNLFIPENTKDKGYEINSSVNNEDFYLPSIRTIARCLDELNVLPGDKFLSIGSGSSFISSIGSYLVGEGKSHGFSDSESIFEFSLNKSIQYTKKMGISLDSLSFKKRAIFLQSNERFYQIPSNEGYNKIFCLHEITKESLNDFEYLLNEKGGSVIASIEGVICLLEYDGNKWKKTSLIKGSFPSIKDFTEEELLEENKIRTLKYLKKLGLTFELEKSIELFIDDGIESLVQFLYLYHQIIRIDQFSYQSVLDAFQTFKNNEIAFLFLTNYKEVSKHFKISPSKFKEIFIKYKFDMNETLKFLYSQ